MCKNIYMQCLIYFFGISIFVRSKSLKFFLDDLPQKTTLMLEGKAYRQ